MQLLPAFATSLLKRRKQDKATKVANAIAYYSNTKAKLLKEELLLEQQKLKLELKELKTAERKLATVKSKAKFLESKYKTLTVEKPKLVTNYKDIIKSLMETDEIEEVAIDSKRRIIVTTKPLKVKKEHWPEERVAGVYQIRLDFSKSAYDRGIEFLNITQGYGHYQSPTISHTKACWGNIGTDIDFDFKTHDIFQLVLDLIDYIRSPHDSAGYIRMPGKNKDTGWEQFFDKAVKRPLGYCFRVHDRKPHDAGNNNVVDEMIDNFTTNGEIHSVRLGNNSSIEVHGTGGGGSVGGGAGGSGAISDYAISYQSMTTAATSISPYTTEVRYVSRRPQLSDWQGEVLRVLRQNGFTEDAAYHFTPMIAPEGGRFCAELNLRIESGRNGEMIVLGVIRDDPEARLVSMTTADFDPITVRPPVEREVFYINRNDFESGRYEQLIREGSWWYRFNPAQYDRHREYREYAQRGMGQAALTEQEARRRIESQQAQHRLIQELAERVGADTDTMRQIHSDEELSAPTGSQSGLGNQLIENPSFEQEYPVTPIEAAQTQAPPQEERAITPESVARARQTAEAIRDNTPYPNETRVMPEDVAEARDSLEQAHRYLEGRINE